MFFSAVAVILSSRLQSNNRTLHMQFSASSVCLHTVVCQWVIMQVFRQIYKSFVEPTMWRLLPNVCRQTSITIHLQMLNKCPFCLPLAALIKLGKSVCILQVVKHNLLPRDVFEGWVIHYPVKVRPFKHVQSPIKHVSAISWPFLTLNNLQPPWKTSQYLCKCIH